MNNNLKYKDHTYNAEEEQIRRNMISLELKRQRQLTLFKRKMLAALTSAIIVISAIIIINTVTAQGDGIEKEKRYKSIMIEYGDTLWDIAKEYYDSSLYTIPEYIEELKSINRLECDSIKSGSYIVVSYFVNQAE
ncbi:MAG: LysM peptidoglycan-binding domain-containing protein [Lachnospiraceae bacterium]